MRVTRLQLENIGCLEKLHIDVKKDLVFVVEPPEDENYSGGGFMESMMVFDASAGIIDEDGWKNNRLGEGAKIFIEMKEQDSTFAICIENRLGSPSLEGRNILFQGHALPNDDWLRHCFVVHMLPYEYAKQSIFHGKISPEALIELKKNARLRINHSRKRKRKRDAVDNDNINFTYPDYAYNTIGLIDYATILSLEINKSKNLWIGIHKNGEFILKNLKGQKQNMPLSMHEQAIFNFYAFLLYHKVASDILKRNKETYDLPLFVDGDVFFDMLDEGYDIAHLLNVVSDTGMQVFFSLNKNSVWYQKIIDVDIPKQIEEIVPFVADNELAF